LPGRQIALNAETQDRLIPACKGWLIEACICFAAAARQFAVIELESGGSSALKNKTDGLQVRVTLVEMPNCVNAKNRAVAQKIVAFSTRADVATANRSLLTES
jgi:hypothetical protein